MKTVLAALAALAASASLASAATLTITLDIPALTQVYSIADADLQRILEAYQSGANTSINGTATPAQVFGYWIDQEIITDTNGKVTQHFTVPAVPGAPLSVVIVKSAGKP